MGHKLITGWVAPRSPAALAVGECHFDGTLADSLSWFTGVLNILADAHRFRRVEPHEYQVMRGLDTPRMLAYLGVPLWKVPRIAAHLRALMAAQRAEIRLFAGVEPLLERLAGRGVALAIVSSNAEATIRNRLGPRAAGLIGRYECGIGLLGKAARISRAVRASGLPASAAIYVGDEIRDLQAARAAGVASAAVAWGFNTAEALAAHRPDFLVEQCDDLAGLICPN